MTTTDDFPSGVTDDQGQHVIVVPMWWDGAPRRINIYTDDDSHDEIQPRDYCLGLTPIMALRLARDLLAAAEEALSTVADNETETP